VKAKTINLSLEAVRRILRLAALEWRDERGMTWLETAPKIKLFPVTDARKPHSLSVEEQEVLFRELPVHLLRMASYKVNAGNREEALLVEAAKPLRRHRPKFYPVRKIVSANERGFRYHCLGLLEKSSAVQLKTPQACSV